MFRSRVNGCLKIGEKSLGSFVSNRGLSSSSYFLSSQQGKNRNIIIENNANLNNADNNSSMNLLKDISNQSNVNLQQQQRTVFNKASPLTSIFAVKNKSNNLLNNQDNTNNTNNNDSLSSMIPGINNNISFGSWVAEFDKPTPIAPLTLHLIFSKKKMRVQLAGPTGLLFVLTPAMIKVPKTVIVTAECGAVVVKEAMKRIKTLDISKLTHPEVHKSIDYQRLLKQGLHVHLKGFGKHRLTAIEALDTCGVPIVRLSDVTDIKYGGCRARKPRRI